MKRSLLMVASLAFVVGCSEQTGQKQEPPAVAEETPQTEPMRQPAAPAVEPSPTQPATSPTVATGSEADQELTKAIRQSIEADKSLPPAAQSITIAAAEGVVTLSGKVPTTEAKQAIEDRVKAVPGVKSVDNQLEVSVT